MSPTNTIHIWNFHPYMVSHTVMQYYLFLFRSRLTGSVSVFTTVRLQHILYKPLSARSFFVELLDLIADVGFSRANTLVNVFTVQSLLLRPWSVKHMLVQSCQSTVMRKRCACRFYSCIWNFPQKIQTNCANYNRFVTSLSQIRSSILSVL